MLKHINTQTREPIEDTEYVLLSLDDKDNPPEALIYNPVTKLTELWIHRDGFAGYVLEIDKIGYEFVSSRAFAV